MRYVILGGSIAGLSAARAIRERDRDGEIVIVTTERGAPYYRPLIPLLIDGSKQNADVEMPDDPYRTLRTNLSVRTVEKIDSKKKTVFLHGKRKLAYDRLLIATGARPKVPRIPGLPGDSLYVLRTALDARELKSTAAKARQIVVIGGGMVGIKTAEALRRMPHRPEITVIEREDHLLPLRLDKEAAAVLQKALEQKGLRFVLPATVRKAVVAGARKTLVLDGKRKVAADLVIAAVGVQPNIEFLKGSGIRTRSGILVDERLQTSVPGVYAAGDVIECKDAVTGASFVSALWTNAAETGRIAGMNMAGGAAAAAGLLPVMNAAEIAGIPIISAGIVEPRRGLERVTNRAKDILRTVVMQEDRVVGMSFLGDIRNAGVYIALIRNRVPLRGDRDRFLRGAAAYADLAATREA